ncbi:retropepsin-like aspartic protease [Chryseobacterium sp. T16E-39]|uniref:retropepsin-like aspartic protease n=1 Tax=Chryseobacterium sp. T16E-39 TaxID=2015076 RepID=UPI0012FA4A3D|nr:retropepsin-like aspartic protease [Chryseobacterium sp. T16E-39]
MKLKNITAILFFVCLLTIPGQNKNTKALYSNNTKESLNFPIDSVDFELGADSRIYVKGKINDSEDLKFLFDTGATSMVFNPNSFHKIKMEFNDKVLNNGTTGSSEVGVSSKNKLQIGNQIINDISFLEIAYPADFWDGVIGLNFIKRNITKIDYNKKKIFFYSDHFKPSKRSIALKIKYVLGVPTVNIPLTVSKKSYHVCVEIDTGSDRVMDLNTPFVKKHSLLHTLKSFATSSVSGSSQEIGKLYNVRFDKVDIGRYSLPLIPGAFSTVIGGVQGSDEMDGVLGNNFLKRFNMTLDLKKNVVYLEPNDLMYSPFYDFLIKK